MRIFDDFPTGATVRHGIKRETGVITGYGATSSYIKNGEVITTVVLILDNGQLWESCNVYILPAPQLKGLYCGQYKITHLVTVERNGGELSDLTMAIGSLEGVANTFVLTQTDNKGNYFWSAYDLESFDMCIELIRERGAITGIKENRGVLA